MLPQALPFGSGEEGLLAADLLLVGGGRPGEPRRLPGEFGRVESPQVAQHHAEREEIGHQVMDGEQQEVLAGGLPEQGEPQQRAALQVEGPPSLLAQARGERVLVAAGGVPRLSRSSRKSKAGSG